MTPGAPGPTHLNTPDDLVAPDTPAPSSPEVSDTARPSDPEPSPKRPALQVVQELGAVEGANPPVKGPGAMEGPGVGEGRDDGEVPWQRLDNRVVWVDAARIALSIVPGLVVTFVFGQRFETWPVLIVCTLGFIGAVLDLQRWMKTRYRITSERIEQRKGWLVRRYRFVPLDRIRSVDSSAKLRHRLAGLRVVRIGSGEASPSFKLDAVSKATALSLRHELLRRTPHTPAADSTTAQPSADGTTTQPSVDGTTTPPPVDDATARPPAVQEDVIARVRWSWLVYNVVSVWSFLVGAFLLWSSFWALRMFGVDIRDLFPFLVAELGLGWAITVAAIGLFLLGQVGLVLGFVKANARFELVRATTENGTALVSRYGLFGTREVFREEQRLRGVQIGEPLLSRWMRLTETEVISTGLRWSPAGGEPPSNILPRAPREEALRVAALVLDDGVRPLEAPLRPHPRGALRRRLCWAVAVPALLAGLLAALGATGAVAWWAWPAALGLLPLAWLLAHIAYRSLGHTVAGPYLVVRHGAVRRTTAALQHRAVIGWKLRESLMQRWFGVMTVGLSTPAGSRYYEAPDIGREAAVAYAFEITPELLGEFLESEDELESKDEKVRA